MDFNINKSIGRISRHQAKDFIREINDMNKTCFREFLKTKNRQRKPR